MVVLSSIFRLQRWSPTPTINKRYVVHSCSILENSWRWNHVVPIIAIAKIKLIRRRWPQPAEIFADRFSTLSSGPGANTGGCRGGITKCHVGGCIPPPVL